MEQVECAPEWLKWACNQDILRQVWLWLVWLAVIRLNKDLDLELQRDTEPRHMAPSLV